MSFIDYLKTTTVIDLNPLKKTDALRELVKAMCKHQIAATGKDLIEEISNAKSRLLRLSVRGLAIPQSAWT